MDGDHVLEDLHDRFDEVLATLEAVAGWQTARVQRPVLILGQLDGVPPGKNTELSRNRFSLLGLFSRLLEPAPASVGSYRTACSSGRRWRRG
jgi:hypothetical protein